MKTNMYLKTYQKIGATGLPKAVDRRQGRKQD